ncbi:MAG: hypothetical protein NT169_20815, partial [Chloroflexi bacterium]|nr:hypothetical protein [Chloroflexota bacterium]
SATVTSSGNSVQVVDYVTPTLPIAVAAGSLDPADVIQGEPVSFRLGLVNPNAMDITLGSGTTLAFTDSNGLVYAAPLLDAPVLPTGVTTTVAFRLTRVATETVPGVYTSTVALVGTDLGGQPVYQSTDLPTPVHAWENMPGLVEVPGSLMPTEPDRYSLHVFWVDLTNTLSCTVTLDMRSQVLLNTGHRSVYVAPLMNAISLRGGEQTRILFASSDLSAIPSRVYHPQLRLFGSAACGPSSISQWIESTGTTELVDQVPHGVGVGGGVPGGGWITQYGGVFPIGVMNGATESRQQLYSVQLLNRCDNEVCNNFYPLPDGTFRLDWPYAYVMPRETFLVNAYIQPTDTLTRSERFDLLVRTCTVPIVGGSFCGQRAISVWVVDRDGKVTIESLDPANTFIQRSAAGRVEIGARNPESGGASSPLTIVPTDTTRLTLRQGNTDVTGFFDMTGADPSAAIPPSATDLAVFTVTPSLTAPAGLVMLDAQITTQGTYPYFFRVGYGESPAGEIYHGPENIVLTGTVTATDFISPAHVYVVDALPLSLAADRLTPAVVAWDATGLTLTAQVSNASDLSFTIFPTSELGITFDPKAALRTGDAFTGTEPVGGLGFAQGFQSPRSFTLGKVGFDLLDCPSDMTLLAQVIAAAPDGGISNNVLGSMTFLVPAHAASRFFTPPFGLALQDGQSYYFSYQLYGGSCSVWSPWSPTDAYPGGQAYSWGASWEPISGDLDIELRSASPNDYSGMLVPGQPVNLPPHTAITLTFANTDTLAGKADGVYTPTLLLRGLFTHTVGTYDFHQHLDGSENPVMVDATPPTAQVEPIGGFSAFPSFVVGWSGSDNLSGLAGFDVQSRQGAGDAWRDWLTDTLALSATFTSPDGRLPYDFRVRATDRVGNPGAWSAAATGPYDAVAPTVAILGLLPYQAAAFTVGWNGSDATAGLAGFDVQVCEVAGGGSAAAGIEPSGGLALAPQDNRLKPLLQKGVNRVSEVAACPQWSVWLTGTSALTATFTGVDLTTYAFRARASDRAGNVSEWTPPVTTTVDAAAGSAALTPLAAWQLLNFAVTWLGADDGAGVVGYDLQSRAATGPWTDWLTGVAITGAIFSGSDGVAYGFRARVTDAAGNIGAWSQEVTATVDATPPSVTVGELSAVQQATDFAVAWSGSDATSGVATFDVQARSDGGDWADWLATTTAASATFTGADGLSYAFRARAADRAGNVGEWSAERATTVNLSAPAVDFVGATLAPVKITQGVPVTFAVNVVNTGELSVTLDTATALAFNDGAGGEFSATLAAATEVPTSTAPSYLQVPLVFAPAEFPAGFLAGSYHPTLRLSGADGDSQPYSATVTSSGNSVQVVDYVTPTLPIAVAAGSLDPADVIQG